MAARSDLVEWVEQAVKANGGQATVVEVAKHIWKHRRSELEASGDLLYTWQYDMRWAAQKLRHAGSFKPAGSTQRGIWALKGEV